MKLKNIYTLFVVSILLSGCAIRGESGNSRNPASNTRSIGGSVKKYIVVDVYYGTDRKRTGSSISAEQYGTDRADGEDFNYGIAEVSIPFRHEIGEMESPVWWKGEFYENPEKHIALLNASSLDSVSFFKKIKEEMGNKNNNDIFVFVHGFNVTFEDSVRRTAQLAHDLGYPGIPVAYSWPSQGAATLSGYTTDNNYSDWSVPHLKQFLIDIKKQTHAKKIHVLAHSMGNKVLTKAIKNANGKELNLNQVILAAPDIDSKIFKEQIAPRLLGKADKYSMYVSSKDVALILSDNLQGGNRVGLALPGRIITIKGIDTIDASSINTSILGLGHSYYGDERELMMDIYHVIKNGTPPESRNLLERRSNVGMQYWELKQ